MYALIDKQAIMVIEGDETVLVAATDPTYAAVHRYLVVERGQDFDTVRQMVSNIRVTVKSTLDEAVSVVDGSDTDPNAGAYRIKHGDPVEEVILATALRLTQQDADLAPLGAFLKRLERNPSQASRSQLFGWLKAGGFTITTEGMIVGYKSVRHDGLSAHAGREPVTVVQQDGTTETVTGHVPYPVGATVWMPRHLVDDDRDSACSVGLHVGTYSYAENFSHKMLVVLVDPADVVSVPTDCSAQKMRVCRLRVAAMHDGEQLTDTVIEAIRTLPDFEATEEYASRPENEVRRPSFSVADFAHIDGWDEDEDEDEDSWEDDSWDDEDDQDDDENDDIVDLDADQGLASFTRIGSDDDDYLPAHGENGDYSGLIGQR